MQQLFGGRRAVLLLEEVVGLGYNGKTLTVLSVGATAHNDENEDDEDLIESWTQRFR